MTQPTEKPEETLIRVQETAHDILALDKTLFGMKSAGFTYEGALRLKLSGGRWQGFVALANYAVLAMQEKGQLHDA